jgi:PAS domain S-box-containing protein
MKAQEALRESEERLTSIMENAPAVIHLKDIEGGYLLANKKFLEWNATTFDKLRGKTLHDYLPTEAAGLHAGHDREVMENLRSVEREIEHTYPDGVKRNTIQVKFPVLGRNGDLAGTGGITIDISALKEAENNLREAKEQAEFANHSKTEFLASMSHELRTPLTMINGGSEIMATEMFGPIGNPKYLEYAKDIKCAGEHLLEMINDILEISRIEMGYLELKEGNTNVEEMIASCHALIKGRANEAGLDLGLEIAEGLPSLRGDALRIKQVVLNLVSNATKFTPKGGTVTLKAGTDEEGRLVLSVTDTGIGIAAEDVAKVLEPFTQVESIMTRSHEGAGIGLSLSKRLVELHDGTLELESELGVGTTVTVCFPLARTLQPSSQIAPPPIAKYLHTPATLALNR